MEYNFSKRISGLQPSAIREILKATQDPAIIPFAAGNPDAAAFPIEEVKKISAEIFEKEPVTALQYGVTEGYTPLRNRMTGYLKEKFNIRDEDVIQAVAVHTLGGIDICNLSKVIYSADKIEPGREQSTDEYRARLFAMSLNELTLAVVEENMEYLKSTGKKIAPSSVEFMENLRSKI